MMIVVKLTGGLGNQMFQYAAGKRLAMKHNVPLKLDISWFNAKTYKITGRNYGLGMFALEQNFIGNSRFSGPLSNNAAFNTMAACFRRVLASVQRPLITIYSEKSFEFDAVVLDLPDNTKLVGYWQSEKYFSDIADTICSDFTFMPVLVGQNLELAQLIGSTCSVSLHIRRGDYVSNPSVSTIHGVCSLDYYRRCIDALLERVASPHFFVFSDDISWVQQNLILSHPCTFISHNGHSTAYEDLRLMSLCKHNIIANSTFSWWGAWLNLNPIKLVFAPKQWFRDADTDIKDLMPPNWIKM